MNIVLMHGFLGFGPVIKSLSQYFNGVAEHLQRAVGARVLTTSVDPIGEVSQRAQDAARGINDALHDGTLDPTEPLHLVAHSMGGLDARFLLSHDLRGLRARTATLVCLGTPHLGSPVATRLECADLLAKIPDVFGSHALRWLREHTDAIHDLSRDAARGFNQACPDVPTVRYLNVAGVGRSSGARTSAFLVPTALVLGWDRDPPDDPDDGVVPFTSATRGRSPFETWPCDHFDLIGHDLDRELLHLNALPAGHLARYE